MDKGLEFEYWISNTLPWQLNLSPSKSCGVAQIFGAFADDVRPLANRAPEEFEQFFKVLKSKIEEAYKFKAPKGYRAYPITIDGDFDKYPNGNIRYKIQKNNF